MERKLPRNGRLRKESSKPISEKQIRDFKGKKINVHLAKTEP
jgi:hypothetical protein